MSRHRTRLLDLAVLAWLHSTRQRHASVLDVWRVALDTRSLREDVMTVRLRIISLDARSIFRTLRTVGNSTFSTTNAKECAGFEMLTAEQAECVARWRRDASRGEKKLLAARLDFWLDLYAHVPQWRWLRRRTIRTKVFELVYLDRALVLYTLRNPGGG